MDDVRRNGHARRPDHERNLNRPRTEKSSRNRCPKSSPAKSMNGAKFSEPGLDSRDIEKPTIALFCLLFQAVSPGLSQHQQHGMIPPYPDPTVGG